MLHLIQRCTIARPLSQERLGVSLRFDYMGASEFEENAAARSLIAMYLQQEALQKARYADILDDQERSLRLYGLFADNGLPTSTGRRSSTTSAASAPAGNRATSEGAARRRHDAACAGQSQGGACAAAKRSTAGGTCTATSSSPSTRTLRRQGLSWRQASWQYMKLDKIAP